MLVLKTDLKQGFLSVRFVGSVAFLVLIGVFAALGEMSDIKEYIEMLGFSEGINQGGFLMIQRTIQAELYLLAIPLLSPLAFGNAFYEEYESRFLLMSMSRSNICKYICAKITATILTAGMAVMLSQVVIVAICLFMVFPDKEIFLQAAGRLLKNIFTVLGICSLGALSGSFWALVGGISATLMKSQTMAYTAPFVLFYIFSEFQNRYYRTVYWLSPKEWVCSVHLPEFMKYGIFTAVIAAAALGYALVMKGRMEHV